MIGLDTNVLIRYLTRDDAAQYARAAAFINSTVSRGEAFVINAVVLCEVVWVLDSVYEYPRSEIADALERVLGTAEFEVERLDEARQALGDYRKTKADFSDALIGRINRSLGATHTATFDRDLKAVDGFRLV